MDKAIDFSIFKARAIYYETSMRVKELFILSVILLFLGIPAWAAAPQEVRKEATPEVEVRIPSSYYSKKVLLFPLELPGYAIKAVTWPIGVTLKTMEKKHVVEKSVDFLSNKEKTFWVYPLVEGGAGNRFGGGVGVKHIDLFHRGYQAGVSYKIRVNLDQYVDTFFAGPEILIADRPLTYRISANWKRELDGIFYGVGNGSLKSNESEYLVSNVTGGANFNYPIYSNFNVSSSIGVDGTSTRTSSRNDNPPVNVTFPAAQIPAFDRWTSYFNLGLGLSHDDRDSKLAPERGGLRSIAFNRYQFLGDGKYDYNRYQLELFQYIPLWRKGVYLVLHNNWVFEQSTGGSRIPFYRLATLDAYNGLRSFSRNRFNDNASAVFNIEYHYPVWNMMDALIFYDTGRVYNGFRDVSFTDFKYSAGGGFNIKLLRLVLFKFRAAYGNDGSAFIFGMSKVL